MPPSLRDLFLLDPDVVYLNHGSFGACPRPVFEDYQHWQRELERNPVDFLGRRNRELMAHARQTLADYVGADADEVVYFPNPTTAVNMVVRNLKLGPGDEVLTTDHEYGACERTWRFVALGQGFSYVRHPMPLPMTTPADFVERFWAGVNDRTRVIYISHITSATALIFPLEEICKRAHAAGILTFVDGAHAPSQIPLDLHALGVDYYTGACHKWLCAPKGSAFLYARRDRQPGLDPLVVSWGYDSDWPSASRFIDYHEWQGTRDMSAYLATPAAIAFQAEHDWPAVRAACHALARQTRDRLHALTGQQPPCPDSPAWFSQLVTIRLPDTVDCMVLKTRLWEDYRVEIPIHRWNDVPLLRVSVQGYNTQADVDTLVAAVEQLLPQVQLSSE